MLLLALGEMRQASASPQTLVIYGRELSRFDIRDVRAACHRLGLTKRKDGETAFPDWPTLKDAILAEKRRRESRVELTDLPPHVAAAIAEDEESTRRVAVGEIVHFLPINEELHAFLDAQSFGVVGKKPDLVEELKPVPCKVCGYIEGTENVELLLKMAAYFQRRAYAIQERIEKK